MPSGIIDSIRLIEASSCQPDLYQELKNHQLQKAENHTIISEDEGTIASEDQRLDCDITLQDIKHRIEELTSEQEQIPEKMKAHKHKAMIRMENQNPRGAILSMKLFKRLEMQDRNITKAIRFLRSLEIDIEIPSGGGPPESLFENFEEQVDQILSRKRTWEEMELFLLLRSFNK